MEIIKNGKISGQTGHQVSYISETQARAHLNDEGNLWNSGNITTDIKCHTFLEPHVQAALNYDRNFNNHGNVIFQAGWGKEFF